ncbi:GIY-YIG nuclease family protein [Aestuariivivens sp. NBU2969]|uniref:GIY-YIG nuclease family protein n=1 Tax=Aestuariivivens sp. NBU2969 TaxID=2873267 RepID=UPI001CBE1894|nr:GIY-YIG nuclease family protein [Aestuariivivens sp. NBU2969]
MWRSPVSVSRQRRDGRYIMSYVVYILYSEALDKYYVGQTKDIVKRLAIHNQGGKKYTTKGIPWKLIETYICPNRSEAVRLERKIKKRGIVRYLQNG